MPAAGGQSSSFSRAPCPVISRIVYLSAADSGRPHARPVLSPWPAPSRCPASVGRGGRVIALDPRTIGDSNPVPPVRKTGALPGELTVPGAALAGRADISPLWSWQYASSQNSVVDFNSGKRKTASEKSGGGACRLGVSPLRGHPHPGREHAIEAAHRLVLLAAGGPGRHGGLLGHAAL